MPEMKTDDGEATTARLRQQSGQARWVVDDVPLDSRSSEDVAGSQFEKIQAGLRLKRPVVMDTCCSLESHRHRHQRDVAGAAGEPEDRPR